MRQKEIVNFCTKDEERLALLCHQFENINRSLNLAMPFDIEGAIDYGTFKKCLLEVTKNHTSLRSRFCAEDRKAIKIVTENCEDFLDFSFEDLSALENPKSKVDELYEASQDVERNIFAVSPMKFVLCKLSLTRHLAFISAHHLFSDYKSGVLVGIEVQNEYNQRLSESNTVSKEYDLTIDSSALKTVYEETEKSYKRNKETIIGSYRNYSPLRYNNNDVPITDRSFELDNIMFDIPQNTIYEVQDYCSRLNCSEVAFYSTAFAIYIGRRQNRERFILGFPVDLRKGRSNQNAIGYLSKPIPVPIELNDSLSGNLVSTMNREIKKAIRYRHFPWERLKNHGVDVPTVNTLFNFFEGMGGEEEKRHENNIRIRSRHGGLKYSSMELWLTLYRVDTKIGAQLEFSKELFDKSAFYSFSGEYLGIVKELLNEEQIIPISNSERLLTVCGSLTLDPLLTPEMNEGFSQSTAFKLQPYKQVLQTLYNRALPNCPVAILFRIDDFLNASQPVSEVEITAFMDQLTEGFRFSINEKRAKHYLLICPSQDEVVGNNPIFLDRCKALENIENLQVEYFQLESNSTLFDAITSEVADIPYKRSVYRNLHEQLLRFHYTSTHQRPKVFVLDCDNTLWKGVAGEVGAQGVEISKAHANFQRELIKQYENGLLLALSSKNNPEDVWAVFSDNSDMMLTREHIASYRIGWSLKSESIREIAIELNLGIDSFLFLDDSPVEIAEVRNSLPELLSVTVPTDLKRLDQFVTRFWPFHYPNEKTIINRTSMYKTEIERQEAKRSSSGLYDFISSLDVQIDLVELDSSTIERASQLTMHTNQFNCTGKQLSVLELQRFVDYGGEGFLISVKDRFGDYGISGCVLFTEDQSFIIENTLLSCRVLGRGVEYSLSKIVAQKAIDSGFKSLQFNWSDTGRNTPGLHWLKQLCGQETLQMICMCDAESMIERPLRSYLDHSETKLESSGATERPCFKSRITEGISLESIRVDCPESQKEEKAELGDSEIETLKQLWLKATNRSFIIPNMSFLEQGGSSLESVYLLVELEEMFQIELTIDDLYSHNTFEELVSLIEHKKDGEDMQSSRFKNMLEDSELSYDTVPFQPVTKNPTENEHILLTGASGFVGIHLLYQLLRVSSNVRVSCLVRSGENIDAQAHLLASASKYNLFFSEETLLRVSVIEGDLGEKRFGLTDQEYKRAADKITRIIHCGASVNFFNSYEQLRGVNVEGTRQLLELAVTGAKKDFVYISTLGVFHSEQNFSLDAFYETSATGSPEKLPTGYQQSKWVGDKLVTRAMERGVRAKIFRLGVVTGNPDTNSIKSADFFVHFQAALSKMGTIPQMRSMDFTPVNFIAEAVATILQFDRNEWQIYHVSNPNPLSTKELTEWASFGGEQLKIVPYKDWLDEAELFLAGNPKDGLTIYKPLLFGPKGRRSFLEVLLGAPYVNTSNMQNSLEKVGLLFPPIDQDLFRRYKKAYHLHGLIQEDNSSNSSNPINLCTIIEDMTGYISMITNTPLEDSDYFDAYDQGKIEDSRVSIDFAGHIPTVDELFSKRKIFLNGSLRAPAISENTLEISNGYLEIAPFEGYRPKKSESKLFLSYTIELVDYSGNEYLLEGQKVSKEFTRMFSEVSEILFTITEKRSKRIWAGIIRIPFQELFHQQLTEISFREGVSEKEKLQLKCSWMGILGFYSFKNYLNLYLRNHCIDWAGIVTTARVIPEIKRWGDEYISAIKRVRKFGLFSKAFNYQIEKWGK